MRERQTSRNGPRKPVAQALLINRDLRMIWTSRDPRNIPHLALPVKKIYPRTRARTVHLDMRHWLGGRRGPADRVVENL